MSTSTLPREHVAVGLQVGVGVADVGPVRVGDEAEQRESFVEHQREQLGREVVRLIRWDQVENLGLENVDPGVDRVAEDLTPGRLLEEPLDPAVLVGHDDPELERVLHAFQHHRCGGAVLPVEREHLVEIEVGERVAADDEEGSVEEVARRPSTDPAVPSGTSSVAYESETPRSEPSPK